MGFVDLHGRAQCNALNQLIDGNSDLVMETIKESITYYSGLQQLSFGVLLIVAVIVVCFSLINLVNTTITVTFSHPKRNGIFLDLKASKIINNCSSIEICDSCSCPCSVD